jgi:hypothetical protein
MLGLGMTAVFGFLTLRNFLTRKPVWGVVSSIGLMLGMASIWIDYQRATTPPAPAAQASTGSPWAKDS